MGGLAGGSAAAPGYHPAVRGSALPPLWRVPAAFALALILMVGTTRLLQGRTVQFWQPLLGIQCERFQACADLAREEGPLDVVFLGTSLTQHGFSATLLEEIAAADLGRPVRAFNLATQGSGIRLDPLVLRDLLLQGEPPRVLVVEASPERLNVHNVFNEDEFLRYYGQVPDALHSLAHGADPALPVRALVRGPGVLFQRMVLPAGRPPMSRRIAEARQRRGSRYWPGDWPELQEERAEVVAQTRRVLRDREGLSQEEIAAYTPEMLEEYRIRHHAGKVRERRLADYEIAPLIRHEFEGLLERARERGVQVVLYDPPSSAMLEELTMEPWILELWRSYLEEIRERYGVELVEPTELLPRLEGLYRDGDHLAAEGCRLFTGWFYETALARRLRPGP